MCCTSTTHPWTNPVPRRCAPVAPAAFPLLLFHCCPCCLSTAAAAACGGRADSARRHALTGYRHRKSQVLCPAPFLGLARRCFRVNTRRQTSRPRMLTSMTRSCRTRPRHPRHFQMSPLSKLEVGHPSNVHDVHQDRFGLCIGAWILQK